MCGCTFARYAPNLSAAISAAHSSTNLDPGVSSSAVFSCGMEGAVYYILSGSAGGDEDEA